MIITHKMDWDKCLSYQIWPAIEKGWKDEGRPVHFLWGLAGRNVDTIRKIRERGEEWWYVDVGYITEQITRYPIPKINNFDNTYFRIVKGDIHSIKGKGATVQRWEQLEKKGIDCTFKGWREGEHVLVCPSSETVTYHINGMTQLEWIEKVKTELKKYTDREIKIRNKPRPDNQWWNTDIKDDLKNCHCLVTNMSLSSVDALLNYVPVIADAKNVAWPVSSREPKFVEKPLKSGRKTMIEWLNWLSQHQFTLQEIEDGLAYKTLKLQYE